MVRISIKDHRGDLVLETTDTTYKEDLRLNKEKLNIWWRCQVEYDDGKVGLSSPYSDARNVIVYNGKTIYADYNFSIDGVRNVYEELLEYFNIDFNN